MPPAEAPRSPFTLREAAAGFLHLLFPTPCEMCRRPLDADRRSVLCGRCWQAMERMPASGCHRCGWPFPSAAATRGAERPLCARCRERRDHFAVARAPLLYRETGVARRAILLCKHGGRLGLLRQLARLLAEEASAYLAVREWDALVPVPLHWTRRWRRGFNQADVLAHAVGRHHGVPVLSRALVRVRATPPQHGDAESRRRNVREAFRVGGATGIAGRRLLLVDDVFTTGATANSCAEALLETGADAVGVLTLARVE
jgi:ComF family protein